MRFAGRVSAANYIAAGQNAAAQSSTFIKTARDNAPSYEEQSIESIRQQAANYENAALNAAKVTNAGMKAVGDVKMTEQDLRGREAALDAKRYTRKAGAVAMAGASLANALKKPIEKPLNLRDKSIYEGMLDKTGDSIKTAKERLSAIEAETYVPDAPDTSPSNPSTPGGKVQASAPSDTGLQLMSDLVSDGYTPVQAAAIAGNAQYESANFTAHEEYAPNAYGTKGAGFFQWTNAGGSNRRTNFENYAKANNLDPKSYAASSRFAIHEMKGGAGNHWTGGMTDRSFRQIQDLDTAVTSFQSNYLRPDPTVANTAQRLANAQALLKQYQNQ